MTSPTPSTCFISQTCSPSVDFTSHTSFLPTSTDVLLPIWLYTTHQLPPSGSTLQTCSLPTDSTSQTCSPYVVVPYTQASPNQVPFHRCAPIPPPPPPPPPTTSTTSISQLCFPPTDFTLFMGLLDLQLV